MEDHEPQILVDMRVGTLKAMGFSSSAIQDRLGMTAVEVNRCLARLERCSDRLAA